MLSTYLREGLRKAYNCLRSACSRITHEGGSFLFFPSLGTVKKLKLLLLLRSVSEMGV